MKFLLLILLVSSSLFSYEVGDTISLDIQKKLGIHNDKITVIDFFASWCNSCEKEIPYISKVAQKVDLATVEIIGVDVDKDISKAKAFQEELRSKDALRFRVINDPQNVIIKEFKPIGMPALFYIQNEKVLKVIYGAIDDIDTLILNDLQSLQK